MHTSSIFGLPPAIVERISSNPRVRSSPRAAPGWRRTVQQSLQADLDAESPPVPRRRTYNRRTGQKLPREGRIYGTYQSPGGTQYRNSSQLHIKAHRKPKKKRKQNWKLRAGREILKYQGREGIRAKKSKMVANSDGWLSGTSGEDATRLLIPKAAFQRVVRDIATHLTSDVRMEIQALEVLQHAAEAHLVSVFQDSQLACEHRGMDTLLAKDMILALQLTGLSILPKKESEHDCEERNEFIDKHLRK